jgi:DNA-binding MarR family transcriptional regulator/GNAT superfamily N-acetyltransferase
MPAMPDLVDDVRAFNRFYTKKIGALRPRLLNAPYSLTEARVLWELAQRPGLTASALSDTLALDRGYLSRLLRGLAERKLVARRPDGEDGRAWRLALTTAGKRAFATLNARSQAETLALIAPLPADARATLRRTLRELTQVLGGTPTMATIVLRPHQAGDIGWVVSAHGRIYAQEYGLDASFEALVAEIAGNFLKHFKPQRECCWIADLDGRTVGSAFVVEKNETTAQLRLVIVDPSARGHGIGRRLIGQCIAFAQRAGYTAMTLWTNDCLHAARHLYEQAGFVMTQEEKHHSFGQDLVGQTWELALGLRV